jgi:hypothetical protein
VDRAQLGHDGSEAAEDDVAAIFRQIREEVRRSQTRIGRPGPAGEAPSSRQLRAEAERLWALSAERRLSRRPGLRGLAIHPVKLVLNRLLRWHLEPLVAEQRDFNAAVLGLVDDLEQRVPRGQAQADAEAVDRPSAS